MRYEPRADYVQTVMVMNRICPQPHTRYVNLPVPIEYRIIFIIIVFCFFHTLRINKSVPLHMCIGSVADVLYL